MTENRTNVWGFGGDANQQWKITKNSDGTYSIKPMDNQSLATEVYYSVDAGEQPVTQYTYNSSLIDFKWRIIQNGDGTVRIMPAISNSRALDVYGGVNTTKTFNGRSFPKRDGIDCQIVDYSGNPHQKWVLESVNYGCAWGYNAKYNGVSSASNCFGYALGINIKPPLNMSYGDSVAV